MKKGWKSEPLGELCDIRNGSTPSKGNATFWDGGTIPWFTIDDMREQGREISSTRQKITKSALSETSVKLLPEDSVLLCCTASVGEFAITRIPLTTNQQFNGLVVKNKNHLDPNFLFHYASTLKDELLGLSGKTTIDFIPISRLRDVAVPVPPLAEQQRIVGLLDEAFEGLATAKANAEKNLQNARALFESHLQSVFTQRGPGWVEKSLGETCEMYQPKTIGTKDLVPEGPYPVFGANGVIGRYDKFNHEEPQLLVTCRGATCGSVNISEPKSWITGNAMVVRPKDHALDLHFLEFVFRGGIDISAAITGAAQPQITRTNLSPLLIRYPKSVTEQTRLAEKFEDLTEETQRLARLYERKHAALSALKKSLLHQAFTGEL